MRRTHVLVASLALAALVHAGALRTARADAREPAAAQALFDEAQRLASTGKYDGACPKYEESQRLDPALGTAFNLADCYEHVGRTASAWALFLEVESGAKAAGKRSRETAAHERAAALEPHLSRLTIVVPDAARAPGLVVKRDGTTVGAGSWGEALPLDPGPHAVEATAPGKNAWRVQTTVTTDASRATVTVPVLVDATTPSPFTTTAREPVDRSLESSGADASAGARARNGEAQRTWALVAGGVGLVGVGIGAVFGARSIAKHDDAAKTCPTPNPCGDRQAASTWSDATSAGTVSTIAIGIGATAIAAGLVLWLTAPTSTTRMQAAPSVATNGGGFVVRGQW